MEAPLVLHVEGPEGRRRVAVEGPEAVLGRSPGNTVRLADHRASRRHCRIYRRGADFHLEDLGSSNGTYLNGVAVTRARLRQGDRIRIGATTIRVELPTTPPARRAALLAEENEALRRQAERLRRLLDMNAELLGEVRERPLLARIVDTALRLTGAERGFLVLLEKEELRVEVARGRAAAPAPGQEELSRSIALTVARSGRPVLTADAAADPRFTDTASVARLGLRSLACVPLPLRAPARGALCLDSRAAAGLFGEEDRILLEAFATQAALALQNARLVAALRASREEVLALNRALQTRVEAQARELEAARRALAGQAREEGLRYEYRGIVGRSPAMLRVLRLLDRITEGTMPVLIQGESGTGKELVARAIHRNGSRARGPFVSENCAAIPAALFESELFGHAKGAFTGADRDRPGLIERAHGGTLFLDEIGELAPELQKKLLRVLEEGVVRRLGDTAPRRVDVRILSATNRDLEAAVRAGRFRADLYYRLCGVRVGLPPLRERREDIPLLVAHFLARLEARSGGRRKRLAPEVMAALTRYDWPGNVRELENQLVRAWHLAEEVITCEHLGPELRNLGTPGTLPAAGGTLRAVVAAVERDLIRRTLEAVGGNKSRAAARLGLSRVGLRKKMRRLGLLEPEGEA